VRTTIARALCAVIALTALSAPCVNMRAETAGPAADVDKVILDTDIGDDIDDAFALALLLTNPHVQLLGITTAWGDTDLRARLVSRFLADTGHGDIPVAAGPATKASSVFSQRRYAEGFSARKWPDGPAFLLDQIRNNPGQITLIGIAPFSTVSAAIDRDPATFRKLKRVVIMGGSIHRRYGNLDYFPENGHEPEYNIDSDIPSSKKLFAAGVPLEMMPLDSTQIKLDEVLRAKLFSQGTPITNALSQLYWQWTASTDNPTPTLYDAVAVAEAIDPSVCPTQPMRIRIDDVGNTLVEEGEANARVCLQSDSDQFFRFYFRSVLNLDSGR
jgi:purine nucleosidase